jgi:hypothetical protein
MPEALMILCHLMAIKRITGGVTKMLSMMK